MSSKPQNKLDHVYSIFVPWFAMPMSERDPQTVEEFCKKFQISRSDVAGFVSRPKYTEDLYRESIKWGKSKIPELLNILYQEYLKSKDSSDLRMYNDILKNYKEEKNEEPVETQGVLRALFETIKK